MEESLIILWVFPISIVLVYILINIVSSGNVKWYYIIAKDLKRGVYSYHQTLGDQIYFKRNNVGSLYAHDKREIIFFKHDGVKVIEGVYIHKSMLWMSVFSMYYYWKFNKIKDKMIKEHNIRESYRQEIVDREERQYSSYVNKRDFSSFKFFRG